MKKLKLRIKSKKDTTDENAVKRGLLRKVKIALRILGCMGYKNTCT
jgi:hypothetical protein